jgi:hypothetical protein
VSIANRFLTALARLGALLPLKSVNMSANELQLPKTPDLPPPPQELPPRPALPQEVPPVQPPDVQSIPPKELPPDVPQELPPEQLPQELPLESPHLQSSTGRSATQQLVGTTIRGTISAQPSSRSSEHTGDEILCATIH